MRVTETNTESSNRTEAGPLTAQAAAVRRLGSCFSLGPFDTPAGGDGRHQLWAAPAVSRAGGPERGPRNKTQAEEHKVASKHHPCKALSPHSFLLLQIPARTHTCTMFDFRKHVCSSLT